MCAGAGDWKRTEKIGRAHEFGSSACATPRLRRLTEARPELLGARSEPSQRLLGCHFASLAAPSAEFGGSIRHLCWFVCSLSRCEGKERERKKKKSESEREMEEKEKGTNQSKERKQKKTQKGERATQKKGKRKRKRVQTCSEP